MALGDFFEEAKKAGTAVGSRVAKTVSDPLAAIALGGVGSAALGGALGGIEATQQSVAGPQEPESQESQTPDLLTEDEVQQQTQEDFRRAGRPGVRGSSRVITPRRRIPSLLSEV